MVEVVVESVPGGSPKNGGAAVGPRDVENAIIADDSETVSRWITQGSGDVNAILGLWTPLITACSYLAPKCVDLLLRSGADPVLAVDGRAPINCVMERAWRDDEKASGIIAALVAAGADVNHADDRSPLFWAVRKSTRLCFDLLVAAGADAAFRCPNGDTLLHVAAEWGAGMDFIDALLRAGADPTAVDAKGRTPFAVAKKNGGSEEVLDLLRVGVNEYENSGANPISGEGNGSETADGSRWDDDDDDDDDDDADENSTVCSENKETELVKNLREALELGGLGQYFPLLASHGFGVREYVKLVDRFGNLRTDLFRMLGIPVDADPALAESFKENINFAFDTNFPGEYEEKKPPNNAQTYSQLDAMNAVSNMRRTLSSWNKVEIRALLEEFDLVGREPEQSIYLRGPHLVRPEDVLHAVSRAEEEVDRLVAEIVGYWPVLAKHIVDEGVPKKCLEEFDEFPRSNARTEVDFRTAGRYAGIFCAAACVGVVLASGVRKFLW